MDNKCLYYNLNSFTRQLNKVWEEEFNKLGLSPAHGYLLRLVLSSPGQTQKVLSEQLGVGASTVTRFVDALEKKGLLKRTSCCDDARAITIAPTKKAENLERELDKSIQHLNSLLCERFGKKGLEDLVHIIQTHQKKFESENIES